MGKEGNGGARARGVGEDQASKSCLLSLSGKAREGGARARGVKKERHQLASTRMEVNRENEAGVVGHD